MRDYDEYKRILELWERGLNKKQIARITDIPRATVRDCINRYGSVAGLDAIFSGEESLAIDGAEYNRAIELWKAGKSKVDIAKMLGITRYMATKHIRQFQARKQATEEDVPGTEQSETPRMYTIKYRPHKRRYTTDELREAAKQSISIAETLRKLGIVPAGGNYDTIRKRIKEAGVDISHFRGEGWAKGQPKRAVVKRTLEEIMVKDSTYTSTHGLRKRLLKEKKGLMGRVAAA